MKWNDLSLRDKADFIRIGVKSGYRDRKGIISLFNKYAEGGDIPPALPPASELFSAPTVSDEPVKTVNPTIDKEAMLSNVPNKEIIPPTSTGMDYIRYPAFGNREDYTKWFGERFNPNLVNANKAFFEDYAKRASMHHPNITMNDVTEIIETSPIEYGPSEDPVGGSYYIGSGNIKMNTNEHNDTYLMHELSHALDYRLGLGNIAILEKSPDTSTYRLSPQDAEYLNAAYLKIPKDAEKRAVNTQLRYRLHKNSGNKVGKELDSYIDKLRKEELIKAVDSLGTSYFTGSDINGYNFNKIKEALKNVASNNKSRPVNYASHGGFLLFKYT